MSEIANNDIQVDDIESLLADYRQGKMVILVDDENRENEGDLLVAAEKITAQHINFMASYGRGLICLTLTEQRCQQLDLPLMVSHNNARFSTNFTVSIEAAQGVTTGISAQDRATTILAAVNKEASPDDIVMPGHIFPIKAQPGGVLTRAGHTEAGVDMARLSGFQAASVICEILKEDGSMARLPDLVEYGKVHGIKIGTIADLIRYRLQNEPTVIPVDESVQALPYGEFKAIVYKDTVEGGTHLAMVHGDVQKADVVPVRVHVHRGLADIIRSPVSSWSWSLDQALAEISKQDCGVVVLLAYNESAEELASRLAFQGLQSTKNNKTDDDRNLRMLGAGGQILSNLGITRLLALGREKRTHGLSGFGLEVVDYVESPQQLHEWFTQK